MEHLADMTISINDLLERLESIFLDTFSGDHYEFSLETTQRDIGEWDSLNQIRLLTAIEQEFGFRFDMGDVESLKDVSAIVDGIRTKIA